MLFTVEKHTDTDLPTNLSRRFGLDSSKERHTVILEYINIKNIPSLKTKRIFQLPQLLFEGTTNRARPS